MSCVQPPWKRGDSVLITLCPVLGKIILASMCPPIEGHCSNLRVILARWFACCQKFSKSDTRLSSLEVEFIMLTKILILSMFD